MDNANALWLGATTKEGALATIDRPSKGAIKRRLGTHWEGACCHMELNRITIPAGSDSSSISARNRYSHLVGIIILISSGESRGY